MTRRWPSIVAGGFLLLCILLGGSTQGLWLNLILRLVAIGVLATVAVVAVRADEERTSRPVYWLVLTGALMVLLQLIPLPAAVWTSLPGREPIAAGFAALGLPLGFQPVSEAPFTSVMTLLAVLPPLAVFAITDWSRASPRAIAAAITAGMVASTLLAAIQVAGGPQSPGYLYASHSPAAVGLFANTNHMGTLLLAAIPMIGALIVSGKSKRRKGNSLTAAGIALLLLAALGILLNGSRSALGLAVPVLLATSALVYSTPRWRRLALASSMVVLVAGIYVLTVSPIAPTQPQPSAEAGLGSRVEIWRSSARAVKDNFPVGTGLGTFEQVYHRYENPQKVTSFYVNHAHNDYLELAVELGLPGILLMIAGLAWWVIAVARIWTSPVTTVFARAATIVTGTILVQSLADFPLRMSAIAAIFAACTALMVRYRAPAAAETGEIRGAKHVTIS